MEPASFDGMPDDVLIVEDDPIIALDFEDTILGFGVKTIRTAGNVAKALDMIAERAPDFALLDVGLVREKSFAIAERLEALKIPFVFVTGYGADVRLPAAVRRQAEAAKTLFDRRAAGLAERVQWRQTPIGIQQRPAGAIAHPRHRRDGRMTAIAAYKVPVARNCAPARCRFCGMLASTALRSATALWN